MKMPEFFITRILVVIAHIATVIALFIWGPSSLSETPLWALIGMPASFALLAAFWWIILPHLLRAG